MASATIDTFCCMSSRIEPNIITHFQEHASPYNIVCLFSSVLGMLGALYQVLPSAPPAIPTRRRNIGYTQKIIINWLAMADFFAAAGILLRSIFWLWKGDIIQQEGLDLVICAVFATWIRFFYTATYMWTFFYAIDVYLVCKQKVGNRKCYHIFTWLMAFILTGTGLGTLYLPHFKCHSEPLRVLPNYLLSYVPIVVIMILNPVLYVLSSKNVRILLTGGLGQLTYIEHNLLAALKEKFFCIVLVFYVCWVPNVINGIILWGFWDVIPQRFLLGVWYFMAMVNPLQAVLNSLVYKGWDDCGSSWRNIKALCCCREQPHSGLLVDASSSDHNIYTPERPTFSTNNLVD
ncbi:G-protein coupled receptor 143-like [Uloborus diversus]|uniref:G-protein coupled receptor 143-like n=1 Tax=Uloborus diversus TaxID=327109 RepID=UPI00240A2312|nr:G-protein coupled receptor 143-like [Uloborus diversus]